MNISYSLLSAMIVIISVIVVLLVVGNVNTVLPKRV